MDEVYELFLSITSSALFGKPFTPPESTDSALYETVFREFTAQSMEALPEKIIPLLPLDGVLKFKWTKAVISAVNRHSVTSSAEKTLLDLLEKNGIPAVVLKGSAAAVYYPDPGLRKSGDVDLLVLPEDFKRTFELIKSEGYEISDRYYGRHIIFTDTSSGTCFELHNKFAEMKDKEKEAAFDEFLFEGIRSRKYIETECGKIPVLPPIQNGLVLLQHFKNHITTGIGFRQAVDFLLYAENELDDGFWYNEFYAAAKRFSLDKLASVTAKLGKKYFGMTGFSFCDKVSGKDSDKILGYLFANGNMGRKVDRKDASTMVVVIARQDKSLIEWIKALNASGLYRSAFLRKTKVLRYFAWVYQLCRYIKQSLFRKQGVIKLKSELKTAKKQRRFFESLDLFN